MSAVRILPGNHDPGTSCQCSTVQHQEERKGKEGEKTDGTESIGIRHRSGKRKGRNDLTAEPPSAGLSPGGNSQTAVITWRQS